MGVFTLFTPTFLLQRQAVPQSYPRGNSKFPWGELTVSSVETDGFLRGNHHEARTSVNEKCAPMRAHPNSLLINC